MRPHPPSLSLPRLPTASPSPPHSLPLASPQPPPPHAPQPQVGQRYGLALLSPVDDAGNFTEEAGPFAGLSVQGDGNSAVVDALAAAGVLLKEEKYEHKYPYDWRTKKPTIFRATDQVGGLCRVGGGMCEVMCGVMCVCGINVRGLGVRGSW
jgi:hypothetical protein